ncbi:MAG: HypC/HybG/HupF family hydrogenase formation chaperone [Novosphingobium sp.]
MCLAVPGELLEVKGDDPLTREGRVVFAGVMRRVNLAYVPEAGPGDYVLVHAGLAIAVIDEAEARRTLALLDEIGPETGR